jgi:putative ATP-binding cassette transporter
MNLLKFVYKISGKTIIFATLFGIASGLANTALIQTINKQLFGETNSLVILFLAFCTLMLVTRIASQLLLLRISQDAVSDLQIMISERIIAAPLKNVEALGSAKIMASLTGDINILSGLLLLFPTFATQISIVFGCLIYLVYLSWQLFLYLLLFIVLGLFLHLAITKKARLYMATAREKQDKLVRQVEDLTSGIKELKLNYKRSDQFINEQMYGTVSTIRNLRISGRRLYIVAQSWGQILIFLVLGSLVFFWPTLFDGDQKSLISQYILVMLFAIAPLSNLLSRIPSVTQANISLQKINKILDELAEDDHIRSNVTDLKPKTEWEHLVFDEVYYDYELGGNSICVSNKKFALGPINLSLYPGQLVFIVGKNGSGKSTLGKLIVGLYSPTSGDVIFNGERVTRENKQAYLKNFSTVFSDYHLFESLLGIDLDKNVDKDVENFIRDFGLERDLTISDGVYSTISLSQGQKRRLAMLNAYLENRAIYLFDEWAADQDPEFRDLFYKKFLPELKAAGKTIIVISHDAPYFDQADRVITIDEGCVREDTGFKKAMEPCG